jgi:HD-GYP domain-containing protein (c-di-GMP phosphodiesterase class II)
MLRRRQVPLYIYIGLLFVSLIALASGVSIYVQYRQTKAMVLAASSTLFDHIGQQANDAAAHVYDQAGITSSLAAFDRVGAGGTLEDRLQSLPFMLETLRGSTNISGTYLGYANGDFFSARKVMQGMQLVPPVPVPPGAVYLVQSRAHRADGQMEGRFRFYDTDGRLLQDAVVPDYVYDPRSRPWYQAAQQSAALAVVAPYSFFTTQEIGTTFARRSPDGNTVGAVDITLSALSGMLRRVQPTPSAELVIFNSRGDLLADTRRTLLSGDDDHPPALADLGQPVLTDLLERAQSGTFGTTTADIKGEPWEGFVSRLDVPGEPLYFGAAVPEGELLIQTNAIRNISLLIAFLTIVPLVPLAMSLSKIATRPLLALTHQVRAIQTLKFDNAPPKHSLILEINMLNQAMAAMQSTIQRFLDIGMVLASERHFDRLLERMLAETTRIAEARGGAFYLAEHDGRLKAAVGHWGDATLPLHDLDPAIEPNHPALLALRGDGIRRALTPEEFAQWYPGFDYHQTLQALCVPMRDRNLEIEGVLVLFQETTTFDSAEERGVMALVRAVAGIAAVTIDTQRLIEEQKRMVEAVIHLIASAIDSKSPYTGRHCERVPALAKMIARAAVDTTDGDFKEFSLTEMQWEELHLAAWLHDCGKILTPEYVVDKATKLETISDRIHEIRTRFEVVKREAEITCWKQIADGAERTAALAALAEAWREIDEDFAFVAGCNTGSEHMSADAVARVKAIGERRWTRTLDDRLGTSREERRRREQSPAPALPVEERLLDDRPDQILERSERERIAPDNPWGIRMDIPEHLYNRGEIYNLTIPRGTLTPEERFKINEHVIDSIRMLSRVPLPRHLGNVLEVAAGHHERMDGRGYPKRLRGDEMSVMARILAVADIFEALTAADRPYKNSNTLSEAVAMLAQMRDEGHIDPSVFALFLSSGVYRDYAVKYLKPGQIDSVDIHRYLTSRAAA